LAGEAILGVDAATQRILEANVRAWELHGYSREELLRLRVDDFVAPESLAQLPVAARIVGEQGRYEGRRLHRRKDGSVFHCAVNLKTVTTGDRRLVIGR